MQERPAEIRRPFLRATWTPSAGRRHLRTRARRGRAAAARAGAGLRRAAGALLRRALPTAGLLRRGLASAGLLRRAPLRRALAHRLAGGALLRRALAAGLLRGALLRGGLPRHRGRRALLGGRALGRGLPGRGLLRAPALRSRLLGRGSHVELSRPGVGCPNYSPGGAMGRRADSRPGVSLIARVPEWAH